MKTGQAWKRTLALAVVAAFAVMPFAGTASASEDEIGIACHYNFYMHAYASKTSVAPGESFTVYVRQNVGYYRDPAYVRGYMFEDGAWNHEFSWGPIWYTGCGYRTAAFTVTAPDEPGATTVSVVSKAYSWPTLSHYWLRSNIGIDVIAPELQIDRAMPTEVSVGEDFRVALTVRNTGTDTAVGTTLEEAIPAGVELQSGGETLTAAGAAWSLGDLAPGDEVTVAYTARALERGTGAFAATARAVGSTGYAVETAGAGSTLRTLGPEVTFERVMPDAVDAGETFEVTVTYTNEGELPATDVTLSDTFHSDYTPVPSDVRVANAPEPGVITPRAPRAEFVYGAPEADATADPVTVKTGDWTTFRWDVSKLAPGESFTVTYALQAPVRVPYATAVAPDAPVVPEDPLALLPDPADPDEEYPVTVDVAEAVATVEGAAADPEGLLPAAPGELAPEDPGVVGVEDNEAAYAFSADAAYATPKGYALQGVATPALQSVRAAHMVEAPVPGEEPPALPEPPV